MDEHEVIVDKIAIEIHLTWVKWAREILSSEKISSKRKKRWMKCFIPYEDLSQSMKDKDLKIARQIMRRLK